MTETYEGWFSCDKCGWMGDVQWSTEDVAGIATVDHAYCARCKEEAVIVVDKKVVVVIDKDDDGKAKVVDDGDDDWILTTVSETVDEAVVKEQE